MLRTLAWLLLAANLLFFGWTQGWLDGVTGLRAHGDREPERLARQVRPETVTVLPPPAADAAASGPAGALNCIEAGPFTAAEVAAANNAAQAVVAAERLLDVRTDAPGEWIVYLGQFLSRDGLEKKAEELTRLKLASTEVKGPPALEPGLSLGSYAAQAAAERALEQFTAKGVRLARVVQLTPPSSTHLLRVEWPEPALAGKLLALKGEALGRGFRACARSGG
jgi:hypothetical protein